MRVLFKNPHPGWGGPVVPLPQKALDYIETWKNKSNTVNEFLCGLEKLFPTATCSVNWKDRYILFNLKDASQARHCWKVIEFEPLEI